MYGEWRTIEGVLRNRQDGFVMFDLGDGWMLPFAPGSPRWFREVAA